MILSRPITDETPTFAWKRPVALLVIASAAIPSGIYLLPPAPADPKVEWQEFEAYEDSIKQAQEIAESIDRRLQDNSITPGQAATEVEQKLIPEWEKSLMHLQKLKDPERWDRAEVDTEIERIQKGIKELKTRIPQLRAIDKQNRRAV